MSQSLCDHHMCHISGVVNFMENLSQKECNTPLKQYTCQIILTTRYITLIKQLESETIHFIAPPLRSLHFNFLEKGVIHTRTLKTSRSYQDIIQILKVHFKYPSYYTFGLNSHHPQYTIDNPFFIAGFFTKRELRRYHDIIEQIKKKHIDWKNIRNIDMNQ